MNSSISRKQMSTPIKHAPTSFPQYSGGPSSNLRSDSKSKLPTLVPQNASNNGPFGQPVEILPSKLIIKAELLIFLQTSCIGCQMLNLLRIMPRLSSSVLIM